MKLSTALKTVAAARAHPAGRRIVLACGFEPLHLRTFLEAQFAERSRSSRLAIDAGLYGDLEGNVLRAARGAQRGADRAPEGAAADPSLDVDAIAIVLEWGDLDPRLGLRSVGAWSGAKSGAIVADVTARLARLREAIEQCGVRVVVSLPTLPLTFFGTTPSGQESVFELALEQAVASFALDLARVANVAVLHPTPLGVASPLGDRHDARSELAVGFPYRLPHASALAAALLALLFPTPPKKALITDLDDTLWAGLVGEIGASAVAWGPSQGAQIHALYQLVLQQLAEMGILLGAASKNEPAPVHAALARADLLLDGARLFPVVANWGPKSASVSAILETWNLGAGDVVFVDDSPLELDEVRRAHPALEGHLFPRNDPAAAVRLFETLRARFGKTTVTADDALRGASVVANAAFVRARDDARATAEDPDAFLRGLNGVLELRRGRDVDTARALELLNKTNQFNLNGTRVTDGVFARLRDAEDAFVFQVTYEDRYGSLGTIGIVAGWTAPEHVDVHHWVLSCRAFSRRIEHHMLRAVLRLADGRPVRLHAARTERNKPLQAFLRELGLDDGGILDRSPSAEPFELARDVAAALEDKLVHTVSGATDG